VEKLLLSEEEKVKGIVNPGVVLLCVQDLLIKGTEQGGENRKEEKAHGKGARGNKGVGRYHAEMRGALQLTLRGLMRGEALGKGGWTCRKKKRKT